MLEIATKYNPQTTEDKWYSYWLQHKYFHSEPDTRTPYTIVIPPPNVTGVLHMGHMLNNTIQDVLVRRARMLGFNACWVPGTDHASIATEAKVVAKLKSEGIEKNSLTREQFLEHAWEWKEKHGGIILEQLKKLGASCDWDRTAFTMDHSLSESVIQVFVDLYRKGKIYRDVRMVNWDPQAKTAVSDEEVMYKEVNSKLYYLKYPLVEDANQYVTIATTRPETILGDTAICVNPNDERYTHLHGKHVYVPLINRNVPIITDEYVEMEFGTGCLKITPAHDINDYHIGQKYKLEIIDIFNEDGTLNEKAQLFVGIDRFEVRKQIVVQLELEGYILKIEDYVNKVGYSERTSVVIEPRLSMQWFLKMKDISKPALDAVMNDEILFHPRKFKNTYRHWMENVRDWNISRQLWWGHQIPAWYLPDGSFVVAHHADEALALAKQQSGNQNLTASDLKQDDDVLDTWFSSWLWPISVFDGIRNPNNPEIKYYYPTNDLVTAPEIIFFWVARMIIAGYEYHNELPFRNVYFTGIVRDGLGRKMSKSLGNSPDPLLLIERYGADAMRVGMLLASPAGNDLPFEIKTDPKTEQTIYPLLEQGRNFANKIWNAYRLVNTWQVDSTIPQPEHSRLAVEWMDAVISEALEGMNADFADFRLNEALHRAYNLFWDNFSSWYLEIVKPDYQKPIDAKTLEATVQFFDKLLHILHPFMPYITEELWQTLADRKDGDSLMIDPMPKSGNFDSNYLYAFEGVKELISEIRRVRADKNISPREALQLFASAKTEMVHRGFESVIVRLANLSDFSTTDSQPTGSISVMIRTSEYFIPLTEKIDVAAELEKSEKELEYAIGFLEAVNKKLSNQKFVDNAPKQVLDTEYKKKADAESKIATLQSQIEALKAQ